MKNIELVKIIAIMVFSLVWHGNKSSLAPCETLTAVARDVGQMFESFGMVLVRCIKFCEDDFVIAVPENFLSLINLYVWDQIGNMGCVKKLENFCCILPWFYDVSTVLL